MKHYWYLLKYFFGAEICPYCGSEAITKRGSKWMRNERWECRECGEVVIQ